MSSLSPRLVPRVGWFFSAVGITAALLAVLAFRVHEPEENAPPPSAPAPSTFVARAAPQRKATLAPAPPAHASTLTVPAAPALSREAVEASHQALEGFRDARQRPNRLALQQELLTRLAADPAAIALLRDTLICGRVARDTFGEHQAEARVLALKLLRHLAETGRSEPLEETLVTLAARLTEGGDLNKRADADLVDMLADLIELDDGRALLADPSGYLGALGFRRALAKHYRRGVFLALNGTLSEEEYHRKFHFLYQD
ncbi:hypothetical protein [Sorangium sp. So ce1182]|uniref:hypothetical protein n=1 Tax=Sorangium sp. So ce1182 TaxID=3133334 RepID=UPI003F63C599